MCGGLRLAMCGGVRGRSMGQRRHIRPVPVGRSSGASLPSTAAYYARVMDDQSTGSGAVQQARAQGIADLLRRSALRDPDKLAVVAGDVDGASPSSTPPRIGPPRARARVAKGDRVAVLSHNCWQYAALAFGLARIGVVLVPINFMLGADEIAYILEHSGASGHRRGRAAPGRRGARRGRMDCGCAVGSPSRASDRPVGSR